MGTRRISAIFVSAAAVAAAALALWAAPAHAALNCSNFPTQAAAQSYLRANPSDPDGLDGPVGPNNGDGVACETFGYGLGSATDKSAVVYQPTAAVVTTTTALAESARAANFPQTGLNSGELALIGAAFLVLGATAYRKGVSIWRVRPAGVGKIAAALEGFDPSLDRRPRERQRHSL
jgi:hypothetical protein